MEAALAEVRASEPTDLEQTRRAIEGAFERHEIEPTDYDREFLPEVIQISQAPRPVRDIRALKILGRVGERILSDTRKILANDKKPEEETDRLIELARSLGDAGREDQDAVEELRQLVGHADEGDQFRRAAEWFVAEGGSLLDEFDNWDRSHRLLRAAAINGPVQPVTPARVELFDQVRSLEEGSINDGWARLVAIQPALLDLEAEIRSGRPVKKSDDTTAKVPLLIRLTLLVGPSAVDASVPLLRTRTARTIVEKYLGTVFLNSRFTDDR